MRKRKVPGPQVEVMCAFCKGTGKDPFDLMSPLVYLPGLQWGRAAGVDGPTAALRLLQGQWRPPPFPHGLHDLPGAGQVTVPEKAVTCPGCGGSGSESDHDFFDSVLSCTVCGGKGVVDLRQQRQQGAGVMQP